MRQDNSNNNQEDLAVMIKSGFDEMGRRFDTLETDVAVLKSDVAVLKSDVAGLKIEVAGVKTELSSEISSVRTEISSLRSEMQDGFLKTNDKIDFLTEKLYIKKVIDEKDAKEIMALSPFQSGKV